MNRGNLRRYAITAAVGAVLVLLIVSVRGIFAEDRVREVMRLLSDASFAVGIILSGVGLLFFASNNGVFDMLGFSMTLLFGVFKRDVSERKYKDFYEYREAKKERKRSVAYLLLVGLGYIAIAAIFLLLYYKV